MSGDYWLNRIGTAASVTTPSGSVPQYGLAADVGTAPWPDAQTFNTWAQDGVRRSRNQDIARIEAKKEQADQGWFQRLKSWTGNALKNSFGSLIQDVSAAAGEDAYTTYSKHNPNPMSRRQFEGLSGDEQAGAIGGKAAMDTFSAPGVKQLGQAYDYTTNVLETPLILDRNTQMKGNFSLWFDSSEWGKAWREAEDRTPGQAFIDAIVTGPGTTEADLDRMRRTNSLYGLATFATDLYVGFKLDPTVLGAKGIGEAKRISIGAMPRGQTSKTAAAAARRVAFAENPEAVPYAGTPLERYGQFRGKRVVRRFEDVRKAALEMNFTDFSNLPMFKSRAVNGPQAALAFQIAAKDDRLWDLTRRAVMADPRAWAEINQLKHAVPEELQPYVGSDTATFIDAIEATKTKMSQLESEVADLEKSIAKREEQRPTFSAAERYAEDKTGQPRRLSDMNPGFFEHHTWELHRDLEDKLLDIADADSALTKYDDYGTWLEKVKDEGVWAHVDQVSTKPTPKWVDGISQRTYQKSLFGKAHTVAQITKAGWMKQANPIDLHRVDSGAMSIRRQFLQFDHLFGYKNNEALDDLLTRFTRAKDPLERYRIAKEVEDVHLVGAIAQHHGLAPETIDAFLNQTRLRKNEMANALLSGQGAVYSTVPSPLAAEGAKLLKLENGMAEIELMDNGRRVTLRVPEEALKPQELPVDPTQTPNFYTPMDTRQVHLAVKRNKELFELLDSDIRNGLRGAAGKTMETVDQFGTAWNSLWKPMQLFRLAWPQRVLMDEGFRAMAMLGATEWAKNFFPALTAASLNAINPTLHGIGPFLERRRIKIGPGPLADEITGRSYDVAAHEAAVQAAPFVPAHLATTENTARRQMVEDFAATAVPYATIRQRAAALLRNPNSTESLPKEFHDGTMEGPANWQDISSLLGDRERHALLGDEQPATATEGQAGELGLVLSERRPEEFDTNDLVFAKAALPESAQEMLGISEGVSDAAKLDRFLMAPPDIQAMIWNGDQLNMNLREVYALRDIVDEFRPGGQMRPKVREAIKKGKEEFEKEVRDRKSGAGHRPLFTGVFDDHTSPYARLELMLAKELGAKWAPISPSLEGSWWGATRRLAIRQGELTANSEHRLYKQIIDATYDAQYGQPGGRAVVKMFDPLNMRETKQGFAVRVASTELDPNPPRHRTSAHYFQNGDDIDRIDQFILQNRDFLSSNGYRLMVEAGGDGGVKLSVVRYFRSTEQDKALDFANHVEADSFYRLNGKSYYKKPGRVRAEDRTNIQQGTPEDTLTPGHEVYVRDWNDQSPIMEALNRRFAQVHTEGDELSTTPPPAEGATDPVFHGTSRTLPERLLPIDHPSVPIDVGRAYGPGFYTATNTATAGSFGHNLYTIKGAHDGKVYRVLDLDAHEGRLQPEEKAQLVQALDQFEQENRDIALHYMDPYTWERYIESTRNDIEMAYGYDSLISGLSAGDLGAYFQGPHELRLDNWLAKWLVREKNIGALKASWGGGADVYVWLEPDNLIIKPAYGGEDKWYFLDEWLTHPESQERLVNQVPESRIIRTGKRDKRFRELEQVHRSVEARQQEFRRQGKSAFRDTTFQALLGREQKIMHELGLEYSHNLPEGSRTDHWWTQTNPERLQREAAQNARAGAAGGDLRRAENQDVNAVADAFDNLDFSMVDSVHERFIRKLLKKREFGKGYSKWKSHDGKQTVYKKLFEGEGEAYVPLISAAPTYSRLTDTYKRTLSKYRQKAVGYKRILPPDLSPEKLATSSGRQAALSYYAEWSDLLNDQIRNSPIWYKMLEGQSDEQIVHWLTKTDEGARIRRSLPHKGRNPERWVEEHRQALDFYLPDTDLQALLRDRKINPSDLRGVEQGRLPEIFGPELEMVGGEKGWGKEIAALSEKIYHALGTVPTDLLSRQPFAKAMYDLKMRNLIRASDSDWLTPEVLKDYEKLSREFALRQVRRTLFDLTDDTNFTQAIRFLAPFWGAQQEAIVKWMNIAIERPETVARFYVGLNQAYDQLHVIDEDGRPVKDAGGILDYNANHRLVLQIPDRLKKLPFFDKALKEFGSVGVAFGSANTALQGDNPLFPSLGPIVTVPADKLANAMWDTHGAQFDSNFFYRWLFPVGRPSQGVEGVMEQIFPGWGRRMLAMQEGQDSRMYANTWFSVQRELTLDAKKRGLPPPSAEEVERATKWHFAMRVLAAFGAPAAMEFRPNNQFFLDQYHEMMRTYGPGQAFEKFVQKYGADAARYAASSSTGLVPPTAKGMEEWSQNKDLVQQVTEAGYPDLAAAIISPEAWKSEFSSDSYREQFNINVGPGSTRKLRESQDPLARQAATDRRVGWLQYRQFMSSINAELYARGLTSLEQSGAEDLKAMKQEWVAKQERDNQAWSQDFHTFTDNIYQQVAVMRGFAGEKRFDSRPDIQGLRQYLMIRDAAARSLDQWAAQGGSRSLQAQENSDLRNWFYDQVGQLIQANPAFGEFYVRFLDSDRLERGSGP